MTNKDGRAVSAREAAFTDARAGRSTLAVFKDLCAGAPLPPGALAGLTVWITYQDDTGAWVPRWITLERVHGDPPVGLIAHCWEHDDRRLFRLERVLTLRDRDDEALEPASFLALFGFGATSQTEPGQDGAPVRLGSSGEASASGAPAQTRPGKTWMGCLWSLYSLCLRVVIVIAMVKMMRGNGGVPDAFLFLFGMLFLVFLPIVIVVGLISPSKVLPSSVPPLRISVLGLYATAELLLLLGIVLAAAYR